MNDYEVRFWFDDMFFVTTFVKDTSRHNAMSSIGRDMSNLKRCAYEDDTDEGVIVNFDKVTCVTIREV